ncbi:MAG: hypothetical protein ACOCXX_00895 [Planctomycetota bacterium]
MKAAWTSLLLVVMACLLGGCSQPREDREVVFTGPGTRRDIEIDNADTPKVRPGERAAFKEGGWLTTGDGLAARATTEKNTYRMDEKVVVKVELRNETPRAFYIPKSLLYYVPIWNFRHEDDPRPRAFAPAPIMPTRKQHFVKLRPFKTYTLPIDNTLLNLTERIDKPGTYHVSIGGLSQQKVPGNPVWTGRFATPEITFEVVR